MRQTPQHTATHCTTLYHTAPHYLPWGLIRWSPIVPTWSDWRGRSLKQHTQQHTATHRNTLHHPAPHCTTLTTMRANSFGPHSAHTIRLERQRSIRKHTQQHTATHWNTLHHTAPPCNTLHHPAPHCTTLHHTATLCLLWGLVLWSPIAHTQSDLRGRPNLFRLCVCVFMCVCVRGCMRARGGGRGGGQSEVLPSMYYWV